MNEVQKAMHWLIGGSTGLSSNCLMATMLNGGPIQSDRWGSNSHPRDSSDFRRCMGLLDAVPEFRERLSIMKQVSPYWSVLVDHWDEIEASYNDGTHLHRRTTDLIYCLLHLVDQKK